MRYERIKLGIFCKYQKWNSIEFLLGINNCIEEGVKSTNFQGHVNYWFSEINNRRYAHEYFFHYNHGLNPKTRNYFKIRCPNNIKVYIFVMCRSKGTIWHVIHENRTLLKIWPHLTFPWPFDDISITIGLTYRKLYIFVILIT